MSDQLDELKEATDAGVERDLARNAILAQIIELEAKQPRAVREFILDGGVPNTQGYYRIEDIENQIAGLRAKLEN